MPTKNLFLLCFFLINLFGLLAQPAEIPLAEILFKKGGEAVKLSENCYQLTYERGWSSGSIWYPSAIDLREDISMEMDLFFGCNDGGADGIVFIFSPRLAMGRAGEGMGFSGLRPSLGIEFDTYQNFHLADPEADHVALLLNGNPNHNYGTSDPIPLNKNIEDCKNHRLKVVWNARRKELLVNLDGQNVIGFQKNIIAEVFNNNPKVYWGLSSATGGQINTHKICFEKLVFEEVAELGTFSSTKSAALLKGDKIALEDVLFESGKAILKKESDVELNKLLALLEAYPNRNIGILGHTDNVGAKKSNKTLSQKRADSVAQYLINNGIAKDRLTAKGVGDISPIASNATSNGRAKNRRVEVYLFRRYP